VSRNTIKTWRESFLQALESSRAPDQPPAAPEVGNGRRKLAQDAAMSSCK
jgi:hypothetical protein